MQKPSGRLELLTSNRASPMLALADAFAAACCGCLHQAHVVRAPPSGTCTRPATGEHARTPGRDRRRGRLRAGGGRVRADVAPVRSAGSCPSESAAAGGRASAVSAQRRSTIVASYAVSLFGFRKCPAKAGRGLRLASVAGRAPHTPHRGAARPVRRGCPRRRRRRRCCPASPTSARSSSRRTGRSRSTSSAGRGRAGSTRSAPCSRTRRSSGRERVTAMQKRLAPTATMVGVNGDFFTASTAVRAAC